jgi:hypothetical protein
LIPLTPTLSRAGAREERDRDNLEIGISRKKIIWTAAVHCRFRLGAVHCASSQGGTEFPQGFFEEGTIPKAGRGYGRVESKAE